MGVLDRPMRNLASTMTRVFGTDVSVEITSPGGYDPATRTASPGGATVIVKGVIGEYRDSEFGDQIKRTDAPLYLPAAGVDRPKNGDQATVDGRRMRVISVETTYAGGLAALYRCQVRQ